MPAQARDSLKRTEYPLLTGFLVVAALYFAREVLVPLALAALLAFILAPAVARLERIGLRRLPSALLVVLLSLSAVAVLGWALLGQVYSLALEFPQYRQNVAAKLGVLHFDSTGKLHDTLAMLDQLNGPLGSGGPSPAEVPSTATAGPVAVRPRSGAVRSPSQPVTVRVEQPRESVTDFAGRAMSPIIHPLTTTFIVVVFLLFMLIGREDLRNRALRLAGSGRMHVTTTSFQDATLRVSRYLQMQLVINLIYGLLAGCALSFIGVPHALLWAVLTCALRFVPYLGIMMAAAGPLLLAGVVSPQWSMLIWTAVAYLLLEVVVANFVEPTLYGSSTGISPIAILLAAIFWTFLWGLPGLLLSTPLTVCLIVIGRQVPRLRYLDILFGERTGLPPSDYFYQRLLAANTRDARALIDTTLNSSSRIETFDRVILPALTMIEEAGRTEEMTTARADELLQSVEELVEEIPIEGGSLETDRGDAAPVVLCLPARNFADQIACLLVQRVLDGAVAVSILPADSALSTLQDLIAGVMPKVICVVGIPPNAVRHIRMRCRQIRGRFTECVVIACVLGDDEELSALRSRIQIEDAHHVVASLQHLKDYLAPVLPIPALITAPEPERTPERDLDLARVIEDVQHADPLDGPVEGIFQRLAAHLARSLDAPMVLITACGSTRHFWEAQCGLPEESPTRQGTSRACSICHTVVSSDSQELLHVVPDAAADRRFADDAFIRHHGIRFCVSIPLRRHDEKVVGSLCVLDTRPRTLHDAQKELVISAAESVMMAIEIEESRPLDEPATLEK